MVDPAMCINENVYAFGQAMCLGVGVIVGVFVVIFAQGLIELIRRALWKPAKKETPEK